MTTPTQPGSVIFSHAYRPPRSLKAVERLSQPRRETRGRGFIAGETHMVELLPYLDKARQEPILGIRIGKPERSSGGPPTQTEGELIYMGVKLTVSDVVALRDALNVWLHHPEEVI